MSDPDLDLIQQTHDAHAALMARINGFLDQVDGDVAAAIALAQAELGDRQAADDGLAANLEGVVKSEMSSTIFWTPTAVADDPANGVFKTWEAVCTYVEQSPAGSSTHIRTGDDGAQYLIDHDLTLEGRRHIKIERQGSNAQTLKVVSYDNGGNELYGMRVSIGCSVELVFANVHFGALATPGAGLKGGAAFIKQIGSAAINLSNADISCDEEGRMVFVNQYAGTCTINLESSDMDGNVTCLGGQDDSIALFSVRGGRTENGAQLYDATNYTVGQNLLFG